MQKQEEMNRKEKRSQYRQLLERRRSELPQAEAHAPISDAAMTAMARRAMQEASPTHHDGTIVTLAPRRRKVLTPISSAVAAAILALIAVRAFTPEQVDTDRVMMGNHTVLFACNNNCDPSTTLASLNQFLN